MLKLHRPLRSVTQSVLLTEAPLGDCQRNLGVAIFHGRDLFGYTAARLASGIIDFEGVGPEYPVEEIVEHEILEPVIHGLRHTGATLRADPGIHHRDVDRTLGPKL